MPVPEDTHNNGTPENHAKRLAPGTNFAHRTRADSEAVMGAFRSQFGGPIQYDTLLFVYYTEPMLLILSEKHCGSHDIGPIFHHVTRVGRT